MSALATYNYTAIVENGVTVGYSVTCTNKTIATYAVIPDTYDGLPVIKIDENAFYNSTVRVVEIPASVQEIGNNALRLKSVIYTERIIRFHSTTPPTLRSALTYVDKIQVPSSSINTYKSTLYYSSADKIEALPVYATYSYTSITTEGSITGYIISGANKSANPTVAIIPETYNGLPVKRIASNAFVGWSRLTDVVIQGNVERIGSYAFDNTLALTRLIIGNDVTTINDYAFRGKSMYSSSSFTLYIPKNVVTIGKYAFAYRYALSSITFEKSGSLTTIGERAFDNCNAIKEIDLPNSLESIGNYAFRQSEISYSYTVAGSLKTVTIGTNLQSVGGSAFECTTLTRVNYRGTLDTWCGIYFQNTTANPLYYTHNLYRTWKVSGVDRYANITTGDITINASTINQAVLAYCTNITSITLTSSVTNIYNAAFLGCAGLQYVKIQNVTSPTLHSTTAFNDTNDCIIYVPEISLNTYAAAPNWSDLYALDRLQAYTAVAEFTYTEVYNDDDELIGYAVACSNISEQPYIAQVPSQYNEYPVLSIVENAFLNCVGMSTLTLPSTIVNIDENAFSGCTSLIRIVYDGTIYNWINIDFANEYSSPVTLGHLLVCKDTTPTKVFINDVSTIKNYAFSGNSTIESVIIESVLTNIGDKAFANCSNITDITLVNEIPPTLGNDVFENLPASAKLYVSSRAYTNYTTIWPELTSSISIDDIRISFILNANTVKELFVKKTKYLEDMLTKVDKTTTIAGLPLENNISVEDLKQALDIDSLSRDLNLENGNGNYSLVQKEGDTSTGESDDRKNYAYGRSDAAFGHKNKTYQRDAFAFGGGNKVGLTENEFLELYPSGVDGSGKNYSDSYSFSIAIGENNKVTSRSGSALGVRNEVSGEASIAIGDNNNVSGKNSVAGGANSKASGLFSQAIGQAVEASGQASAAIGFSTKSSGVASFAEGDRNIASGRGAHAEGTRNTASGDGAHAEGYMSDSSFIGTYGLASGVGSHVENVNNIAKGVGSHAGGYYSIAQGAYHFVHGIYLISSDTGTMQAVFGKYNADDASAVFIVGNGNGIQGDVNERSNAFEVTMSGVARAYGTPVGNNDLTPKKYVDDAINTKQDKLSYEIKTIQTMNWTALSSSTPYTYSTTVSATATISTNTIVELVNDNPILFVTYGFAIASVSGQSITIYSIGLPDTDVSLKIGIGG